MPIPTQRVRHKRGLLSRLQLKLLTLGHRRRSEWQLRWTHHHRCILLLLLLLYALRRACCSARIRRIPAILRCSRGGGHRVLRDQLSEHVRLFVVDEVAARAIGTVAGLVVGLTRFRLVLRMARNGAFLGLAMSVLAPGIARFSQKSGRRWAGVILSDTLLNNPQP